MTKDDLLQSLGTIARSGTAKFAEVTASVACMAHFIYHNRVLCSKRIMVMRPVPPCRQWFSMQQSARQ